MGLSLTQRREAERLQQRGNTLREIARNLEVSFEEVCLSLYGGLHDWSPRIGQLEPKSNNQEDDDGYGTDEIGNAGDGGRGEPERHVDEGRAGAESAGVGTAAGPAGTGDNATVLAEASPPPDRAPVRSIPEPGGAAPAPERDRAPQPPAQPTPEKDQDANATPVAPSAPAAPPDPPEPPAAWLKPDGPPAPPMYYPPGMEPAPAPPAVEVVRRYWLTNGAGEYLRKSGSGMTRNKAEAWSGTAQQMEQAFKAKPTLKDLDPERVPG